MDGIHDLGGKQGFGPIELDDSDEPFHEPWEGRVRGLTDAMSKVPDWNTDWFRYCRELIPPVEYLTRPYYDQRLQTYCAMLVNSGIATIEEIASGKSEASVSNIKPPMSAAQARKSVRGVWRYDAEIDAEPLYRPGDLVRARSYGSLQHTRLPTYVRGHRGRISRYHGAHVLPDANALGEVRHEHLYNVRFEALDLWPERTGRTTDGVYLCLWESYLEAP